ncbi:MAG: HRDC domain-containing protein [Acidobacteriota bacterium]
MTTAPRTPATTGPGTRFHVVRIPAVDPERGVEELNQFLSQHRVLDLERQFVDTRGFCGWMVWLSWVESSDSPGQAKRPQVDYREKLSPEDFRLYSRLRTLRKEIAGRHSIAAYLIFNNEQLATMVERRVATLADLEAISGVGPARVEKHGQVFLDELRVALAEVDSGGERDATHPR